MKNTEQQLPPAEMKELQTFIDYLIKKGLYKSKEDVDIAFRFHTADKALPLEEFLPAAVVTMYCDNPELFSDYVSDNYLYFGKPFVTPLVECFWDNEDERLGADFTLFRFSLTSCAHFYYVDTPPSTYFDSGVWQYSKQIIDEKMMDTFKSESDSAYYAGGILSDDDIDGEISFKVLL